MSGNILVSILIPCYNSENSIIKNIESCIKQTYKNIEIIIIDDGSTDNTYIKIEELSNIHKNIRIYKQENMGISFTRNRLVSLAKGDYIFFLDSDDYLPINSLDKLINNSENGEMNIVIGTTKEIFNFKNRKKITIPFIPTLLTKKNMDQYKFVKSNMCLLWGCIFKRDFFQSLNIEFDINLEYFEDISISTFIFLKSQKFKQIKDLTYYYVRDLNKNNNLSSFNSNEIHKFNDFYFAIKNLLDLFKEEKWDLDKKMVRYINGAFFPIFIGYDLLIKNFTKNVLIRSILRNKILTLLSEYNYKINVSKTWWKFILYFYIKNNFNNYTKMNKLRKVVYIRKNKNIYNGLYSTTRLLDSFLNLDMKRKIYIVDLNYIKNNIEKYNNKKLFSILTVNHDDDLHEISDFLIENKILISGFSLNINIDIRSFLDLFPNFILLNFDLRDLNFEEINNFINKNLNFLKENIEISFTIRKNMLKYMSTLNYKYDFLFIEDKSE